MTLVKFKNGNGNNNFPSFKSRLEFPSFFSETLGRILTDETLSWMPAVNIKERDEDFKIDLAVPGMDKKDFTVEVENDVLVVSGERKEETSEENEKLNRREFHYGSFRRSFNLPETANTDNIVATYKDGILSLVIVKREEAKLKPKKQININ